MKNSTVSSITRNNWFIAASLAISGLLLALSSVYFLLAPSGGYQGGRNPYYDLQIIFSRQGWDLMHTWSSVVMISLVLIHVVFHWTWVKSMSNRIARELTGKAGRMNNRARANLVLNLVVAVTFVLAALSGVYFMFFPKHASVASPLIIFTPEGWDLVHTWSGVALIGSLLLHIVIHWKWIVNVAARLMPTPVIQLHAPIAEHSEQ